MNKAINSVLKYFPYMASHFFMSIAIVGIMLGGHYMWAGFLTLVVLVAIADYWLEDMKEPPQYSCTWILDAMLYLSFFTTVLLLVCVCWMSGNGDLFGIGMFIKGTFGFDPFLARENIGFFDWVGCVLTTGLMMAVSCQVVAHELYHRYQTPIAVIMSKWLLAPCFDVPLVISHLYGHHLNTGNEVDHTTGRKGENAYQFIYRSTVDGNINAWNIESARLEKKGMSVFNAGNRVIRGYLMSLLLCFLFYLGSDLQGLIVFILSGVLAKSLLELVNYIQHYGLKRRDPTDPIGNQLSWNSAKKLTNWVTFNVAFHSVHHTKPNYKFWELYTQPGFPNLAMGYIAAMGLALVPFFWHRVMDSKLEKLKMQEEGYSVDLISVRP